MSGEVGLGGIEVLMHRRVHRQASVNQMGWPDSYGVGIGPTLDAARRLGSHVGHVEGRTGCRGRLRVTGV